MNRLWSWAARRLRFSLRSLLLFPILAAAILGFVANGAHRQRTAVAEIKKQGGWVKYDFQLRGYQPRGPQWFLKRLGLDYSNRVLEASIPGDTRVVRGLSGLRFLEINGDRVIESRLKPLKHLRQLERLSLRSGSISEQGLRNVANIPNLKSLDLGGTKLNGVSLAPLRASSLEELGLAHVDIADADVPTLVGMPSLKTLSVKEGVLSSSAMKKTLHERFADGNLSVRRHPQIVAQPMTAQAEASLLVNGDSDSYPQDNVEEGAGQVQRYGPSKRTVSERGVQGGWSRLNTQQSYSSGSIPNWK